MRNKLAIMKDMQHKLSWTFATLPIVSLCVSTGKQEGPVVNMPEATAVTKSNEDDYSGPDARARGSLDDCLLRLHQTNHGRHLHRGLLPVAERRARV